MVINELEVEHTQFHNAVTMFVTSYEEIPTPSQVGDSSDHICITTSRGPEFWGSARLGSTALAASLVKQVEELLLAGYNVTIDVAVMRTYGLIQMTSRLRRSYPGRFQLLIVVKMSEPDVGGWSIKIEPGNMFTPSAGETGVYVGSFDLLKTNGYTPWIAYAKNRK